MDIFSIGEMVIDFIPGSQPGSYIRNPGGAPANMAIAAARNGIDAGFCGLLGDDDFGHFLESVLEENNVRILCSRFTQDAITTLAFVTLSFEGERSFTFARKPGADMLLLKDDVCEDDIKSAAIIHAGSCSLSAEASAEATFHALKLGKKHNKLISFDVNYRNLLWNNKEQDALRMINMALQYVSVLKLSEEETVLLGGDIPAIMREHDISVVVETLGDKGARCFYKNKVINAACRRVECVDSTGAGDAFWGTFLSGLIIEKVRDINMLTDEILARALREGNIAGALCVQKKGAINSLPTRRDIESAMEKEVETDAVSITYLS